MTTVVVSAAIVEQNGRFLVTRRLKDTHLEGRWEFPGGKCDAGESHAACLQRELLEELAVEAVVEEEVLETAYDYSDRRVELHFLRCRLTGEPVPQLGQEMKWVTRIELAGLDLPPADARLVEILTQG